MYSLSIYIWTFINKLVCKCLCSFLLDINLGVELLGYSVTVCLTFWGTVRLSHSLINTYYTPITLVFSIIKSISRMWSGISLVVLIRIFMATNDIKHFFMRLLAMCISSIGKQLYSLTIFKLTVFLSCVHFSYALWNVFSLSY